MHDAFKNVPETPRSLNSIEFALVKKGIVRQATSPTCTHKPFAQVRGLGYHTFPSSPCHVAPALEAFAAMHVGAIGELA